MNHQAKKNKLDELHDRYNRIDFIENDPISVPHRFSERNDREIAGFLAATIAWGKRPMIVRNALHLVDLMENTPYDFTMNATEHDLKPLNNFVHRTFNGADCITFVKALRNVYANYGGIGAFFEGDFAQHGDLRISLSRFRTLFFAIDHEDRTKKHLSSIDKRSACKRLNMYLRWMIRHDDRGVDFGLWEGIPASALYLPLDLHSANISREFGLLTRTQNDWRAVEEVTEVLRGFDPTDPVKYDFALFGAGIDGYLKQQL